MTASHQRPPVGLSLVSGLRTHNPQAQSTDHEKHVVDKN